MENIATQATRLLIKVKKIDWTKVKEDGYKHDVFSELYSVIGDGLNEMFDTQELRQKIKEKVKNGRIQTQLSVQKRLTLRLRSANRFYVC